jgi:hypothetical protein
VAVELGEAHHHSLDDRTSVLSAVAHGSDQGGGLRSSD